MEKGEIDKNKLDNLNRQKISILLIALMTISVGILSGCTEQNNTYDDNGNNSPTSYLVSYEVTGTAESVSVTYTNRDGGTSQESNVDLPWSCPPVFCPSKIGDWLYISAQNNGDYGSVTTKIYVDGELFKKSTSYGAYVIATSSGFLE